MKKIVVLFILFFFLILPQGSSSQANPSVLTYNLELVEISGAWEITKGSKEVVVAVIDSGVNTSEKLPHSIRWENEKEVGGVDGFDDDNNGYIDDYYGFDFTDLDNDTSTDVNDVPISGHGTMVSSIIAGTHEGTAPYGIAPEIKIMDLRALDSLGSGGFLTIFQAVEYAVDMNASIISMSLGYEVVLPFGTIIELVKASDAGIPVIVSAGNNPDQISSMAKDPNTIAISAIDQTSSIAYFSSTGPSVDFTAPGVSIPILLADGSIVQGAGTSFSAPHVSGIMALMLSARSDLSSHFLKPVLEYTSIDLGDQGKDDLYGAGLVNATAAVSVWRDFELYDFDNDGIDSGEEIVAGLDPFIADAPVEASTVVSTITETQYNLQVSIAVLIIIPILLKREKNKI